MSAVREHPWASILPRVSKPARYLGGEEQQIRKDGPVLCRFVLAFPDVYEVGMSHLGTRILYELINGAPDLACERAFTPWVDMEAELRRAGLPLVSLERWTPLSEFDVLGVSLQHELCYTNVLANLDLGGISLRSVDRQEHEPIVLAGGPTATHPEPLAPFIDAFLVGEAEEVLPTVLRTVGHMRQVGASRREILAAIAVLPGMYVPAFYELVDDERTGFRVVAGPTAAGKAAGVPEKITRAWVRNLDEFPFPTRFPVPRAEAIFDRAAVEITRGCTEGCRFCQAGIIYRPVRERSPEAILKAVLEGVDNAGYRDTSLTALSTADVSCISPLIKTLVPELAKREVSLGVSSLRAYGLDGDLLDEIKRVGLSGLTFAPEAGTQRMRDVINKNVSDQDILDSAQRIFERGYDRMKMYFIMGLPTETDEDVRGMIDTGIAVRQVARKLNLRRMPQVTVSVSQHVPKPHTPFQWAAMDTMESLHEKVGYLRMAARRAGLQLRTHDVRHSWLECLFARGDRKMADVLEHAYRAGARFDGWQETFELGRWLDGLQAHGVDPDVYTQTLAVDGRLPWDHIDIGLEPDFLAGEWRKAVRGRASPPCGKPLHAKVHHTNLADAQADARRLVCYDCGIACDMSQMRSERIDALRDLDGKVLVDRAGEPANEDSPGASLGAALDRVDAADADSESQDDQGREPDLVSIDRLRARLPRSALGPTSAFSASAEAPHCRVRLFFAKSGPLRFIGHLDLLRNLPRLLRRAGLQVAMSRGYNPTPRMAFAPALALGVAADEDVVDIDLILPESVAEMTGRLGLGDRRRMAADVVARLAAVAPEGLTFRHAFVLPATAPRLGQCVAAADFAVELTAAQVALAEVRVPAAMAESTLLVRRHKHDKRRAPQTQTQGPGVDVDVRAHLISASVDGASRELRFRLGMDPRGTARPREVVEALLGLTIGEHSMRRVQLVGHSSGAWVGLRELSERELGRVPAISGAVRTAGVSPAAGP